MNHYEITTEDGTRIAGPRYDLTLTCEKARALSETDHRKLLVVRVTDTRRRTLATYLCGKMTPA